MIEWCKIEEINGVQFLISKNFKDMSVCSESQSREHGFVSVVFQCQDGEELDETYNNLDADEIWGYYQETLAQLN